MSDSLKQHESEPASVTTEFMDGLTITREPRSLFSRYFLAVDSDFSSRGIYLRRQSFNELRRLHDLHVATRNPMLALFDPTFAPVPQDSSACIVAYDSAHEPIATIAVRLVDTGKLNVKDAMEDLSFWFGERAPEFRSMSVCRVNVPGVQKIQGRLLYAGAMWTRPDRRNSNLAIIITRLMRIYAHCTFDFDYEVAVAQDKFNRDDVRTRYSFAHCELGFTWDTNGDRKIAGPLLWSPASYMEELAADTLREYDSNPPNLMLEGSNQKPVTVTGIQERKR